MNITDGNSTAYITELNWPLAADLIVRSGYDRDYIENISKYSDFKRPVQVDNLDDVLAELSVWGIPWQKDYS